MEFPLNFIKERFWGIGGLVGAGRTELLRLLFGIDSSEGSLLLNGEPVEIHSPRDGVQKGIAFLPEDRKDQGLILNSPFCKIPFSVF